MISWDTTHQASVLRKDRNSLRIDEIQKPIPEQRLLAFTLLLDMPKYEEIDPEISKLKHL